MIICFILFLIHQSKSKCTRTNLSCVSSKLDFHSIPSFLVRPIVLFLVFHSLPFPYPSYSHQQQVFHLSAHYGLYLSVGHCSSSMAILHWPLNLLRTDSLFLRVCLGLPIVFSPPTRSSIILF